MRKALFFIPLLLLYSLSEVGAGIRVRKPDFKITGIQVNKTQAVVSVTNLSSSCPVNTTVAVKLALRSASSLIKDYSLSKTISCPNSGQVVPVVFTLKEEHSMGGASCDVCSVLEATVDPNKLLSETNESNNVFEQHVQ